ncbi:hypothetical protein VTI28DRAFT_3674 [Corynascus sepedonium]
MAQLPCSIETLMRQVFLCNHSICGHPVIVTDCRLQRTYTASLVAWTRQIAHTLPRFVWPALYSIAATAKPRLLRTAPTCQLISWQPNNNNINNYAANCDAKILAGKRSPRLPKPRTEGRRGCLFDSRALLLCNPNCLRRTPHLYPGVRRPTSFDYKY